MELPRIEDVPVEGRRVIVRADLNVPVEDGEVTDDTRIRAAAPTIRAIVERGGRPVVIAHLDRPGGERKPEVSLRPLVELLEKALDGIEVRFCGDCVGAEAERAASALEDGQCLLCENLRYHDGERACDDGFVEALSRLGEVYVNDAFSASHRAHASLAGLPRRLPHAAGLLLRKEVETLERLLGDPKRPYAAILGGAKPATKIPVIARLAETAETVMVGGVPAAAFLKAQGLGIGGTKVADEDVRQAEETLGAVKGAPGELLLPVDVVTALSGDGEEKIETVPVEAVPEGHVILDIGPETVRIFADAIGASGTVVWNGPLGAVEKEAFREGSHFLAAAIGERTEAGDLVSVVGGGDTVAFLNRHRMQHMFSYASMAGGAFLAWVAGDALPGLDALAERES